MCLADTVFMVLHYLKDLHTKLICLSSPLPNLVHCVFSESRVNVAQLHNTGFFAEKSRHFPVRRRHQSTTAVGELWCQRPEPDRGDTCPPGGADTQPRPGTTGDWSGAPDRTDSVTHHFVMYDRLLCYNTIQ